MNREQAKKLLPIIQAFAEGKEIQWKHSSGFRSDQEWRDAVTPSFSTESLDWRIKPEKRTGWLIIYTNDDEPDDIVDFPLQQIFPNKEEAQKNIKRNQYANCPVAAIIEITYEEGQGL